MKRNLHLLVFVFFVFSAIFSLSFVKHSSVNELALNSPFPMDDSKMKDVSGKPISLNELKTEKGLLVIFSSNTCPYVKLSESRIKDNSDFCLANGIGCILVNSNESLRTEDDSFEEMIAYFSAQKLSCAYAMDEKSQLANAFGATRTPQCFLFGVKGLIYKGAIDDNVKDPSAVKVPYLKDALAALLKNETPKIRETKSIGCTVKRAE